MASRDTTQNADQVLRSFREWMEQLPENPRSQRGQRANGPTNNTTTQLASGADAPAATVATGPTEHLKDAQVPRLGAWRIIRRMLYAALLVLILGAAWQGYQNDVLTHYSTHRLLSILHAKWEALVRVVNAHGTKPSILVSSASGSATARSLSTELQATQSAAQNTSETSPTERCNPGQPLPFLTCLSRSSNSLRQWPGILLLSGE